jgi:hypothetical protein
MWPVEFYSQDFLQKNPLAQVRLRYNADTAKCKSTFGDDMAILHKAWQGMEEATQKRILSSQKTFVDFLNHLLPTNTLVASWLPLLKHSDWRHWILKLVSHPWGRATLVSSQLTTAFACHHPGPFFGIFREVDEWFQQHFTGIYPLIDAEDMSLLISRSTNFATSSNLRSLFFPVWPADFTITTRMKITGELYRLNVSGLKEAYKKGADPGFPEMTTPVVISGTRYRKRRPDFLSRLTDAQYLDLFLRLRVLDETAVFPNWHKLMRDETQHTCQVFSSVMKHVITWFNPAAKPPGAKSADVISYTWEDLVVLHVIPRRQVDQVLAPAEPRRGDPRLSAREMVDALLYV